MQLPSLHSLTLGASDDSERATRLSSYVRKNLVRPDVRMYPNRQGPAEPQADYPG
jgi:hypothetical protein